MPYELIPEESPKKQGFLSTAARIPGQIVKEAVSTAVGIPGDVGNLINQFVAKPISKAITGQEGLSYEDTTLGKILPTSAKHRKNLEEAFPSLKPKNKIEEFVADLTADTASLLLPVKTKVPFKNTLAKAFGTALGANVLGEGVTDITGDEKKGAYTKMGALFGLSLLNQKSANKFVGDLYSKSNELLPKGAMVNSRPLENSVKSLRNSILKGRSLKDLAPSEKFVVEESDKILRNVQGGLIDVEKAVALKRSLNEQLQGIYQSMPDKAGRVRAKKLSSQLTGSLKDTMKEYGKQNPEWYKVASSADEAFGTLAKSNVVSNFVKNNITTSPVTHGLLEVLGAGAGLTPIGPAYLTAKIMYRISKSPVLRKYYGNTIKAALKDDVVVFNKELARLDKELQKEKSQDEWQLIE